MKICIIRIDRMGDMILTLPIIKSIKSLNSSTKISIFGSKKNVKVIRKFQYINKIINIDNYHKIKREKYDLILNFSPGWKSFFICLFSNSTKKASIIFTSRYKNNFFSKLLIYLLSKIFFQKTLLINRIKRFKNNQSIHQTQIMFELIKECQILFNKDIIIEPFLPKYKNITSEKNICLIHLSAKWINNYYQESNFLALIEKLQTKFNLILTSDETTRNKFSIIYQKFKIVENKDFKDFSILSKTTIFDKFNFEDWVQLIYLSNLVITPECGCTHIASLCKIPSKIIYDPNNKPEMIYAEYAPWKSQHELYTFDTKNLNSLLTKNL